MGDSSGTNVIFWFRQDLRISDNPGFSAACQRGFIIPIYILDDVNAGIHKLGAASRWWLNSALEDLDESLGGFLRFYVGDAHTLLPKLVQAYNAQGVFWNRCYEPWRINRDTKIKQQLSDSGIEVLTSNGSLLWEPWQVFKKNGDAYRVYTPFYRRGCLSMPPPRSPIPIPKEIRYAAPDRKLDACALSDLNLLSNNDWHLKLSKHWDVGEKNAQKCATDFVSKRLNDYREGRNFPYNSKVSRLSPYLRFGQISPNVVWFMAKNHSVKIERAESLDTFLSELGWREFSYYTMYHFPELPVKNLQARFDKFPWHMEGSHLRAWEEGNTGFPLVDAGMRELWETGYMHNRVRMVVGSFLVKNLLIHWHHGQRWFWDCLVDADLASNSAGWQWVAGCGTDAAPFFRIFNPITQSEKFDAEGRYIRRFVPQLSKLSNKYIHAPWLASSEALDAAGVKLGDNYPHPIVDVKISRALALAAFEQTKSVL